MRIRTAALGVAGLGTVVAAAALATRGNGDGESKRLPEKLSPEPKGLKSDTTFGRNGITTVATGREGDMAEANFVQQLDDGSTLMFGDWHFGAEAVALVKLRPDGTRDAAFGKNGIVELKFGEDQIESAGLLVQPDGKIVLHTIDINQPGGTRLTRYAADGTLDKSFGRDGTINTHVSASAGSSSAVAPDGKLYVSGSSGSGKAVLARFTRNGHIDWKFGDDGIRLGVGNGRTKLGVGGSRNLPGGITKILIGPDRKIVLATDGYGEHASVFRLHANGRRDASFGEQGRVELKTWPDAYVAPNVALTRDGGVVASEEPVGSMGGGPQWEKTRVHRFDKNGEPVRSFGNDGVAIIDVETGTGADLETTPSGRVLVSGAKSGRLAIGVLTADGKPDPTVGKDGVLTRKIGAQAPIYPPDSANAMHLRGNSLVVAGNDTVDYSGGSSAYQMVAARYRFE